MTRPICLVVSSPTCFHVLPASPPVVPLARVPPRVPRVPRRRRAGRAVAARGVVAVAGSPTADESDVGGGWGVGDRAARGHAATVEDRRPIGRALVNARVAC